MRKNNIGLFDMDSIPLISKNVAFRNDNNGILIFQINTDEMYFVSNEVAQFIKLCNGANTCQDLFNLLKNHKHDFISKSKQKIFFKFINDLKNRKIINLL